MIMISLVLTVTPAKLKTKSESHLYLISDKNSIVQSTMYTLKIYTRNLMGRDRKKSNRLIARE